MIQIETKENQLKNNFKEKKEKSKIRFKIIYIIK